jgi:hypothetical protein
VIGRCSLLPTSHPWLLGKCARIILPQAALGRINLSQGAFGMILMILQNLRRLPVGILNVKIAALGFEAGYWKDLQN